MTKEFFIEFIETYARGREMFSELESVGFNLSYENKRFPLESISDNLFEITINALYTDDGHDLITWFIFDCEMGKNCKDSQIDSVEKLYDAIYPYKKGLQWITN